MQRVALLQHAYHCCRRFLQWTARVVRSGSVSEHGAVSASVRMDAAGWPLFWCDARQRKKALSSMYNKVAFSYNGLASFAILRFPSYLNFMADQAKCFRRMHAIGWPLFGGDARERKMPYLRYKINLLSTTIFYASRLLPRRGQRVEKILLIGVMDSVYEHCLKHCLHGLCPRNYKTKTLLPP